MSRLLSLRPLGAIARRLLDLGRDARCPVAVIENGTTDTQRTIVAPLTTIADEAAAAGLQPDASRFRSHPQSSGRSTFQFVIDRPPCHLGPGWRKKAG
jgi:precorrin-4 methylase